MLSHASNDAACPYYASEIMPIRAGMKKTDKVCKFVNINLFFLLSYLSKLLRLTPIPCFALFVKKIQVPQPLKGEMAPQSQSQLFSNVP